MGSLSQGLVVAVAEGGVAARLDEPSGKRAGCLLAARVVVMHEPCGDRQADSFAAPGRHLQRVEQQPGIHRGVGLSADKYIPRIHLTTGTLDICLTHAK